MFSTIFHTLCICVLQVYNMSLLGHIDNYNTVSYDISVSEISVLHRPNPSENSPSPGLVSVANTPSAALSLFL